ncbi:MAG: hypothetical protein ABH810_00505 [bacterium]
MVTLDQKRVDEFNDIYEKEYGKRLSNKDAWEAAHNLMGLAEILYEQAKIDFRRQERLKKEPKGFHLEGGPYNCHICYASVSDDQTWYDKYGIKCLTCQRAKDKGVIPKRAVKDRDSWLASWQLKNDFGIHPSSIRRLVREGKLKARTILDEDGTVHYQIFLVKENAEFLRDLNIPGTKRK